MSSLTLRDVTPITYSRAHVPKLTQCDLIRQLRDTARDSDPCTQKPLPGQEIRALARTIFRDFRTSQGQRVLWGFINNRVFESALKHRARLHFPYLNPSSPSYCR